jgi:GcrA cell cycle regulator
MSWTSEQDGMLQKLWSDGKSAGECANEINVAFGTRLSRNACLGRIYRKGWGARDVVASKGGKRSGAGQRTSISPAPNPGVGRPARSERRNIAVALPKAVEFIEPVSDAVVIPLTRRVTLMELRETTCRFPIGDPRSDDFHYCGAHKPVAGGPYCASHAAIAYTPATQRRTQSEDSNMKRRLAALKRGGDAFSPARGECRK